MLKHIPGVIAKRHRCYCGPAPACLTLDAAGAVIELRSNSPAGLVVETPLGRAASRVFLRHRSIVAALIRPSSRNADPSQSASPPCARSVGIHRGSFALRYLAHGKSIISHTWTSSSRDCYEYRFGRSAGAGGLPRPASESLVSRCSCRSSTRSTSRRGCVPYPSSMPSCTRP